MQCQGGKELMVGVRHTGAEVPPTPFRLSCPEPIQVAAEAKQGMGRTAFKDITHWGCGCSTGAKRNRQVAHIRQQLAFSYLALSIGGVGAPLDIQASQTAPAHSARAKRLDAHVRAH